MYKTSEKNQENRQSFNKIGTFFFALKMHMMQDKPDSLRI